jgi:hypothetical protein
LDSLSEVRLLVRNSGAILDSLTKFEFQKSHVALYQKEIKTCYTDKAALGRANIVVASQMAETSAMLATTKTKLRKANAEKWSWRTGTGVLVFLYVKKNISTWQFPF